MSASLSAVECLDIERACAVRDAALPNASADLRQLIETYDEQMAALGREIEKLETQREFLRGALATLHLPAQPIRALLQVFERARFSNLPVTRLDRSVALAALDEIRTDLGRRGEDEAQP